MTNLIMPQELKSSIIEFALVSGIDYFIDNGYGRRYCNLNKHSFELSKQVQQFAKECYNSFGVEIIDEPMFGNFIGVNSEDGYVHPHCDFRDAEGRIHTRLNFLVSKPELGGMPIIDKVEYVVEEDGWWFNLASEWLHSTTPVNGPKKRIVLSLGSFVCEQDVEKLLAD